MIILEHLTSSDKPRCACIGCFDGVHLGHREILSKAVDYARERGYVSLVYTFSPFKEAPVLTSPAEKIRLLDELGIDQYYCRDFTSDFAETAPEDFVQSLKQCNIACVVVGQDFTFGKGGLASAQDMREMCAKAGIDSIIVPLVLRDGQKVSSTVIRDAISRGDLRRAQTLMGGHHGE